MRLIDADKIPKVTIQVPGNVTVKVKNGECLEGIADVPYQIIEDAPTIDPESLLPRGTWEGTADGYADGELVYDTWTCSECGYTVETDDPDDLTKFCPNCGAKMEGGHNP